MFSAKAVGACLLALCYSAAASPLLIEYGLAPRDGYSDSPCTNGPQTRQCWKDGFSVATDFDNKIPDTGKTRKVSNPYLLPFQCSMLADPYCSMCSTLLRTLLPLTGSHAR